MNDLALWSFALPSRYKIQLGDPGYNLFSRMSHAYPGWLYRDKDGNWNEVDKLPNVNYGGYAFYTGTTFPPANPTTAVGFSGYDPGPSPKSSGPFQVLPVYDTYTRLYRGGPTYIIGDTFKAELVGAVTSVEPTGYGAYISAAPNGSKWIGDEIYACGKDTVFQQPHSQKIQDTGF